MCNLFIKLGINIVRKEKRGLGHPSAKQYSEAFYKMADYVIITDSSCDFTPALEKETGVKTLSLSFLLDGRTYKNDAEGSDLPFDAFYAELRNKKDVKTAAVNQEAFRAFMEPILEDGTDILYIGFSSGLSSTYNAGAVVARELSEKYPERKAYAIDSLCASLGQGLLVYLAAKKKAEGMDIDTLRDWCENNKMSVCHQFTVDDLMFLKRGGRISAVTAVAGTMLAIKPVLHVDDEGHLINVSKARGRRASINALFDRMKATYTGAEKTVFISHGDCIEDANYLASLIKAEFGVDSVIGYVGPVIGAHSGPGTLALFYIGSER